MKKFSRNRLMLAIACASIASILGGKTQAVHKNNFQNQPPFDNMGGEALIGLTKGLIIATGAAELVNEGLGVCTKADVWYKGKFSIANGVRHIFKKKLKPEEMALVDKILDVMNTFETEKSIKNNEDFKKKDGKLKNKIIEYRKSKCEFDRIKVDAFQRDDDPPADEDEKLVKDKKRIVEFQKRRIINELQNALKWLNKIKVGEKLVGTKVSFPNNGVCFTYRNNDYIDFKVISDGSLYVNFSYDGIKFKCKLNKPGK